MRYKVLFRKDLLNVRFQIRQLVFDDVPDDFYIDTEILVNQNVAQAGDLLPID